MRIKKTVIVKPNSQHQSIIEAIMRKIHLTEVSRVVVGGYMSDVEIVITYEGTDEYVKLFKNIYIEIPIPNSINKTSTFYCLEIPSGYDGTLTEFKAQVLKIRDGESDFKFKQF